MNDLTFTPQFLEELIASTDSAKLQKATSICGEDKMCLYDFLSTNDENIGLATMAVNQDNLADKESSSKPQCELGLLLVWAMAERHIFLGNDFPIDNNFSGS